jgi:hypothetical protein
MGLKTAANDEPEADLYFRLALSHGVAIQPAGNHAFRYSSKTGGFGRVEPVLGVAPDDGLVNRSAVALGDHGASLSLRMP